jgi:riboflavin transporter FmnP
MKVNTRTIAAVIIFAALTIALNLSPIKFPAPYAPFLYYQIWEIPIVAAFLLFGAGVGILIALINTAALLVLFPGALPTGPLYNLAAILSMLLGIGIVKVVIEKRSLENEVVIASLFTTSGLVLRTIAMAILNYVLLRFPPPVGYSMPEEFIIATIPLVTIFNITLALYTIPIGYSLAKTVKISFKSLK